MFRLKSITHKLIFIGLIILTFMAAFTYAGFRFTHHIKGEAGAINLAGQLRYRSFEMSIFANKIIRESEEREPSIRKLKEEIETTERIISYFKNGNRELNIKPIAHYKGSLEIFNSLSEEWNNELKPSLLNIAELREDAMMESFKRYDSRVHDYVYEKVDRFVKSLEIHYERDIRKFDTFRLYALGFFLFPVIFIVLFLRQSIIRPLYNLRTTIEEIEKGNFDIKVDIKTRDEIGDLCNTFNNMVLARKKAEEELKQYSNELLALVDASNVILTTTTKTICDIVVRNFGLKMAWLGLIEEIPLGEGGYRGVKPVAQSVFEGGNISSKDVRFDNLTIFVEPSEKVIKTKTSYVINDIGTKNSYPTLRMEAKKSGYSSFMAIPLLSSEAEVIGVLNLYSSKPQFFTKEMIKLFHVFANHAAVAIENMRLIEGLEKKVKDRTRELETYGYRLYHLYEMSLARRANAYEFANFMLGDLAKMLDVDGAAVCNIRGGPWIAYAVSDRRGTGIKKGMSLPLNETYCGIVKETNKPLVINDATLSEEFKNHPGLVKYGIVSYCGVPVFIGDEFFGVLFSFSKNPHNYSEYDLILHHLLSKRLEFEFIKERYEEELRVAMFQADAANRAKSDFLANMSHELRTPLNTIIGFSEMMLEGMAGTMNPQQREYIAYIYDSGKHLLSLIDDILDLSKIELGKMTLKPNEFSLRDLINASLIMFKEKALKHNIKAKVDIEKGAEYLIADERKIKQVIINLLSNAFKFTPDGGSIFVQARRVNSSQFTVHGQKEISGEPLTVNREQDYIEISVEDTGIGISEEDMPRLFQPFQQLETTLSKKYPGTGLGLSLSRRFIELHGGRIWAESEVGKGSRFTFVIPVKTGGHRQV